MKYLTRTFLLIVVLTTLSFPQKADVYSRPLQTERSHDFNALHYRIKINLDIENKSFKGETTVLISPLRDGFDRCLLDAEDYIVHSVSDNWGNSLQYKQTDKSLLVFLAKPHQYGEKISFTVFYSGQEPKGGLRFFQEGLNNPALVASNSWPTNVHHWFPCYDYPNDKVTTEIIATVKNNYKVVANGRLVNRAEDKEKGTVTYHWSQERPHSTYLVFLAAAPYVVVKDSYETVPINYWVYPQHESIARISFKNTPKMMAFFNKIYGYPYPWAKYDQVVVPFGGGMESTSNSAMGQVIMHDEKGEKDFSNTGIVSHELAHQWWGDLITLRSWAHTWMNESFGTYSDYLYYNYERGKDEGAVNLLNKKNSYLREARTRYKRPIVFHRYNRPGDMFDSHTYPKGAIVLHMLRNEIGDKAFFLTLKTFLHEYAFQAVDTHDFIKTVKKVTGQDLSWFYDQWLFKPGHPVLDIGYTWDKYNKKLNLRVLQTQGTDRIPSVFKMPVRIGVVTEKGKKIHSIRLEKKEDIFRLPCEQKPLMVRFDEGNFLLKEWTFNKSFNELIYQLNNDDVIGRMWAASELARYSDNPDLINNLTETVKNDPFWGVRRNAVQTIGKIKSSNTLKILKKVCNDSNSKVRASAVSELAKLNKKDLAEFFINIFKKENSYVVQAQALKALGTTGNSTTLPFIKKALSLQSPRNVIKRAAEQALNNLKGKITR